MSSPNPIRVLPADAIAGIAAGEVVERPASVVKELVENSLDAGATRVVITYEDRGVQRIEVADNGGGIPEAEVPLAFYRHATSKLRSLRGLPAVPTFGFRGEALASIAAVSQVEMITRTAAAEAGTRVMAGPAGAATPAAAASPAGTRVVVADLFSHVPARRKFLRSKSSEYGQVADAVRRFALLRPEVHFELHHNGRPGLELFRATDLRQRLGQVWGDEEMAGLVDLQARHSGMSLGGLVATAGGGNGSARRVALFVNGRWMRDRVLFRALMEGCRGHVVKGRYPTACLFLELDPEGLDLNVHPAKLEVRFSDSDSVVRFVVEAVGAALRQGVGPLGRPARKDGPVYAERPEGAGASPERLDGQLEPSGYRPAAVEPLAQPVPAEEAAEPLPGLLGQPARVGALEVVGQVFDGYLVCQAPGELLLVDQHALHERIIYERLMEAYESGRVESQPLLVPLTVSVGVDGVEALESSSKLLHGGGWELEPFGSGEVMVRAVPALVAGGDTASMVERTLADIAATGRAAGATSAIGTAMASAACHAAVRVGRRMERGEARALLEDAASVDYSASCPHGRPVAKRFDRAEVERMFGR